MRQHTLASGASPSTATPFDVGVSESESKACTRQIWRKRADSKPGSAYSGEFNPAKS